MTEIEQVYRLYFNDVYRYIRKLSGDENIAEEITSETFFKAVNAISAFRGDCNIRVWLYRIAKNCYFTYLKNTKRTTAMDGNTLARTPSSEPGAEEQCVLRDDAEQIRLILSNIPETYRDVFMQRVFSELPFKEIGRLFGKSANWAAVTYYRAKKMIQSKTEGNPYEK